jgi:hypothetical protein
VGEKERETDRQTYLRSFLMLKKQQQQQKTLLNSIRKKTFWNQLSGTDS